MAAELTLAAIPYVLDDDEVPSVLGFEADGRRCIEIAGVEYRRGIDRCTIDYKLDAVRLRAVLLEYEDNSYIMATVGPILNEWWPLLHREGGNPLRPLLSAAVGRRGQTFKGDDRSVNTDITIDIVPPTPPVEMTAAVVGVSGRMTDECLLQAHFASLCIIKAALLILGEYRTLVNPVPNVNLDVGGVVLPLATYLDVAAEAADAIAWTHSPS